MLRVLLTIVLFVQKERKNTFLLHPLSKLPGNFLFGDYVKVAQMGSYRRAAKRPDQI